LLLDKNVKTRLIIYVYVFFLSPLWAVEAKNGWKIFSNHHRRYVTYAVSAIVVVTMITAPELVILNPGSVPLVVLAVAVVMIVVK
jgi:hypothetical protein